MADDTELLKAKLRKRLQEANAAFNDLLAVIEKPPQTGTVIAVTNDGLYQVKTVQGTKYAKSISTGKIGIGQTVAINIPNSGVATIDTMPA